MFRTRLPLVASFTSAIFVASFLPANSASIAGTTCTKINSTKVVANFKYTCVKSGKKLVWNKGVSIKTTPTPSLSPKPIPTSTQPKIEIKAGDQCLGSERGSLRTSVNGTFICQHDNSEAFRWFAADPATNSSSQTPSPSPTPSSSLTMRGQSSSEYFGSVYKDLTNYLSPDHNNLRITLHISENANAKPHQKYMESIELGARLWYKDFNDSNINIILFTEKDGAWVDQKQRDLMGNWLVNPDGQLQSNRMKQYGCALGGFYFPNIILACVNDETDKQSVFGAAMIFVHEFTHLSGFTSMQLTNKPIADSSRFRPAWVEEGMATFTGFFGASQLDPNFYENRNQFLTTIKSEVDRNSIAAIVKMFNQLENNDYSTNVQDSYFLGALAFEYLGKNYGVSKIFETNRLFYQGNSWRSSFLKVYGFTLDDLYPKVADAIVAKSWAN